MGTQITQLTPDMIALGRRLDLMVGAVHRGDQASYAAVRREAQEILNQRGFANTLPMDPRTFEEESDGAWEKVMDFLTAQRTQMNGDPFALPLFCVALYTSNMIVSIANDEPDAELGAFLGNCIEDIGLERALLGELERYAGLARALFLSSPENRAQQASMIAGAADDFMESVAEEFNRVHGAPEAPQLDRFVSAVTEQLAGVQQQLVGIEGNVAGTRQDLAAFRAEALANSERLEKLIKTGDPVVHGLLDLIIDQMEKSGGIDRGEARRATVEEPKGFLDRVNRWLGGGRPAGVLESALWAALDFVPGGIGIKLGITLVKAVGQSLLDGPNSM
jgi:hypothetical protein